jgi:hypothetical protein
MGKTERERLHRVNLDRINRVQVLQGRGDRARVDHEGTLLERARLLEEEIESHRATERGLAAFDRLLRHLEQQRGSPAAADIAAFLGAVWSGRPLPLATLRGLGSTLGDDMLAVLDAFRWARLNLAEHVDGGPARVSRVLNQPLTHA